MGKIFKCEMLLSAVGQDIENVLYYRDVDAVDLDAQTVADAVAVEFGPTWASLLPSQVTVVGVRATAYSDVSGLMLQEPLGYAAIGLPGAGGNNTLSGALLTATVAFTLGGVEQIIQGTPERGIWRRSYLAFGPMPDGAVQDNGDLVPASQGAIETALLDLLVSLSTPEGELLPVRVRWTSVGGVQAVSDVAELNGVTVRTHAGTRRSRFN